jgi:hypothetical protein
MVALLTAVVGKPQNRNERSFTMKKRTIYSDQSQELLTLFEHAGTNEKVMLCPLITPKDNMLSCSAMAMEISCKSLSRSEMIQKAWPIL